METKRKIPYGVMNWAELVRECFLVDNTRYIRELGGTQLRTLELRHKIGHSPVPTLPDVRQGKRSGPFGLLWKCRTGVELFNKSVAYVDNAYHAYYYIISSATMTSGQRPWAHLRNLTFLASGGCGRTFV